MAVCTNKQEKLANDLLVKLDLIKYFDFVAGSDTFDFNKPDARHLTNVVEILEGNLKKTIMVGDSEVDEMAAINAKLPFILIEDGYTGKTPKEIKQQKALFGSKAVNYFVRFMDAKRKWRRLPDYFIKQVIENSEKL